MAGYVTRDGRGQAGKRPTWHLVRESAVVCLLMLTGACATSFEIPAPFDDTTLRQRARTVTKDGIRISAAVPSVEESKAIFGVDLSERKIQPLWLEVENGTDRRLGLLPTGVDPEYFSPLEVSFAYHASFSDASSAHIDEHLASLNFENPIDPKSTVSGFIYTNAIDVTKFVNVDLVGVSWATNVTLLVSIPGGESREDHWKRVFATVSQAGPIEVEDASQLRELLEQLPCCASNETGGQTEPLNVVVIGELAEAAGALVRRDYRYTAVSPRYVFGRSQDGSAQKRAQWAAAQPHVTRFWLTTIRYRGKPVWIAQASSPLGGRFAEQTGGETESLMDPEVDEARNDLVQDMIYSQSLAKIGWVKGMDSVKVPEAGTTSSGAPYFTDGLRAVLLFQSRSVSISEIEFFGWERLTDHYRQ